MASFVIVVCSKCGGLSAAKDSQKTRKCPYCGFNMLLSRAKRVALANNAREASMTLKTLKRKTAYKRRS